MLANGGAAGKAAAAAIPSVVMSVVTQVVPYFDFASMVPAILSMILQLLAAGFACCSDKTYFCSKLWVVVALPCLLLTLGWNGALLGAGVLSDRAVLLDQWNKVTGVCSTALPSLEAALADAAKQLADAEKQGAAAGSLATAKTELLVGQNQLKDFQELCVCLGDVPASLRALIGAGLLGVAAAFLSLICINGLCCSAGCCRRPRKNAQVANAPDDEYKDGDDVDLDETEIVDEGP